jgi:hypothetical protein
VLEPNLEHLVELLRVSAADPVARRERGLAARRAAERLSWERAAGKYAERITALANRPSKQRASATLVEPFPFEEDVRVRVLATPAWHGEDALSELLDDWAAATTPATSACLYLLADPAVAGDAEQIQARVLDAARRGGVSLDACADVTILLESFSAGRDRRLHLGVDAYVSVHPGCAGHCRLAKAAGVQLLHPGDGNLAALLKAARERVLEPR